MGNRILRNVNSSSLLIRMICFLSDSGSCLEWYSELPCDDSSPDSYSVDSSDFCSNDDDSRVFDQVWRYRSVLCLKTIPNVKLLNSSVVWCAEIVICNVINRPSSM